MNTIKIYLAEDGSLATLQKDFSLYQYEYQNKLLNVYVPTSIVAGPFVDNNITTGYSCQIKLSAVNASGSTKITGNFYMRYVKTLTQNGVEYALFERLLPYAFTIYSGVNTAAPQLTISVVNISIDVDENTTKVLSVINSQTCALEVNPSTQVQSEVPEDPSDLDTFASLYSTLVSDMALKQDKDDPDINLDGNDHTVVGNINSLLTDNDTNQNNISDLQTAMTQAQEDITDLFRMVGYGVNIIGTITKTDIQPSDAQVIVDIDAYVLAQTGGTAVRGQAVIVKFDYSTGSDTIYLYVYSGASWSYFELQFLNDAENGISGLVAGNYNVSGLLLANNFMVDIQNGVINNIYRVDSNGDYADLKTAIDQVISKLINGNAVAKAVSDANGNNIVDTYMTQSAGATKTYVQDYASPKALYDLNYCNFAEGEFVDENDSESAYGKAILDAGLGYTTLCTLTKTLEADILVGNQNGVTNTLWLFGAFVGQASSYSEDLKIRITTQYNDGTNIVTLSYAETDAIDFETLSNKRINLDSTFDNLTDPITLKAGWTIIQTIELWREASVTAQFVLTCNTTYPSSMTFNKIGFVRYALEARVKAIEMADDATTIENGKMVITGTGKMTYENEETDEFDSEYKIPVEQAQTTPITTAISDSASIPTASAVKTYVEGLIHPTLYKHTIVDEDSDTHIVYSLKSSAYTSTDTLFAVFTDVDTIKSLYLEEEPVYVGRDSGNIECWLIRGGVFANVPADTNTITSDTVEEV